MRRARGLGQMNTVFDPEYHYFQTDEGVADSVKNRSAAAVVAFEQAAIGWLVVVLAPRRYYRMRP